MSFLLKPHMCSYQQKGCLNMEYSWLDLALCWFTAIARSFGCRSGVDMIGSCMRIKCQLDNLNFKGLKNPPFQVRADFQSGNCRVVFLHSSIRFDCHNHRRVRMSGSQDSPPRICTRSIASFLSLGYCPPPQPPLPLPLMTSPAVDACTGRTGVMGWIDKTDKNITMNFFKRTSECPFVW
jgi:hypothetical protein